MKIQRIGAELHYTRLATVVVLVRRLIGRPVRQRDRLWEVTLPVTDGIEIRTWAKIS